MKPSRERFLLLVLILLAVGVRFAYVLRLDAHQLVWSDERAYDRIAVRLAETGQYTSEACEAAPVLPAFLAMEYKLFGHDYRMARLGHACLAALLILAVFGIGVELFNQQTAWFAAIAAAFYPSYVYLSGVFYAEHLFAVLLALSLWCTVRWQARRRWTGLILAGATLGLATLCRPVAFAIWPVVTVYVAWRARAGRRIMAAVVVAAAAFLTVAPWTIRNAVVFGRFVPVSVGGGLHLWRGNNDVALGDADDRHLMPLTALWKERARILLTESERSKAMESLTRLYKEFEGLDEVQRDGRLAREAWNWIREHPVRFIVNSGHRLLTLYSAFSKTVSRNEATGRSSRLLAALSFYPVLCLGLIGAVLAARAAPASWIIHGTIAAMALPYVLMTACTRFRLPVDALWIVLAGHAAACAFCKFQRARPASKV